MRFVPIVVLIALCVPVLALAQFDPYGSRTSGEVPDAPDPGDICGQCPDPDAHSWGVTFLNGEMWLLTPYGTFYILQGCTVVNTFPISNPVYACAGLGYDSHRGLLVVTDCAADVVHQVQLDGTIVTTWPAPGPGAVGAAYDPVRDLYWFSDWELDVLNSINPNTGNPGPTLTIPAGSRIAGTGYDPEADALVYHGRDQGRGYWISAATGDLIDTYVVPGGGNFGGQGAGVEPMTRNVWLVPGNVLWVYCIEGPDIPVAVEGTSWSVIKARYQ